MDKKKFVGFGEMMVRLAPSGFLRFGQADSFTVNYTGAEANMCVSLSLMGIPSEMVTKFPDNEIGRCAKRMLTRYEVGTKHITWGGEGSAFTIWNGELPSGLPRSSMTANIPPSRKPILQNLTGTAFLRMRGGSISPGSLQLFLKICRKPVWKPVSPRKNTASWSAAT